MPEQRASASQENQSDRRCPRASDPKTLFASDDGPPRDDERVSVLLPLPLAGTYDYLLPADLPLAPGAVVTVPLGPREVTGVVWDNDRFSAQSGDAPVALDRLKPVLDCFDVPPITEVARRFIEWLSAYYMAPLGSVLRMALSVPDALRPAKPQLIYGLDVDHFPPTDGPPSLDALQKRYPDLRLTAARSRVLAILVEGPARPLGDLAKAAGVSTSVIKGLQTAGTLVAYSVAPRANFAPPDLARPGPTLTAEQADAVAHLRAQLDSGDFAVTVLDGVTGSGKTEVYFEALASTLAAGRQALVLLPEIALSSQWLQRFQARFGVAPGIWHSDLSQRERRLTWRAVAEGDVRVVVGARSALFLPYPDLGLIVVDEEHDGSYKQEDGVAYHARDMAVVRARSGKFPVVLASATPSLESLTNVQAGRYEQIQLNRRHGGALLPDVALVDLRRDPPKRLEGVPGAAGQSWLSGALIAAVEETIAAGEQAMLYLNRRGYAPLTLCRTCGHRLECPNCTAWLVEHRLMRRLQCHHCGFSAALSDSCPACGTEGSMAACGPGVERLGEEVARRFPEARQAVMASDTLTGPAAMAELVEAIQAGEVDILIGTQIAAKGHHFPGLTLVGVVDGDLGLHGGDLRAGERSFQLLQQVAGRAGRAERPGRVLVQTAEPDHPVMQALKDGDRDRFMTLESDQRQRAGLPPFGRLAAVILSGPDQRQLDDFARGLLSRLPAGQSVKVLGPAPAPLAILRGRHRRRFLVKGPKETPLQDYLAAWLGGLKLPGQLRLRIDIDPYSFL